MPKTILPLYVLCLLTLSSASFIYPWREKRSNTDIRQCLPCGPELEGNCFGPKICCGHKIGCIIDRRCLEENELPDPCLSGWKWCGEQGRCAVSGTCCTTERCFQDDNCLLNEADTEAIPSITVLQPIFQNAHR